MDTVLMEVESQLFLDANQILFISLFFIVLAGSIFFARKMTLGKKNIVQLVGGGAVLLLLSFLLHYQRHSGEGVMQGLGWPHDVYSVWTSFDKSESHPVFTPHYLLANCIFYASLVLLILSVGKRGKPKKKT